MQSFAADSDPYRNPMIANVSFTPELERLGIKYGKQTIVLKGRLFYFENFTYK